MAATNALWATQSGPRSNHRDDGGGDGDDDGQAEESALLASRWRQQSYKVDSPAALTAPDGSSTGRESTADESPARRRLEERVIAMAVFGSFALLLALRLLLSVFFTAAPAHGTPQYTNNSAAVGSSSDYWVSKIARAGTVAYGAGPAYTIYRNVKEFGAKGDGVTDDTAAINLAISTGSRCGLGCDSSTVTPAIVYFPSGTYLVSAPIIQYYYTQFIGDALQPPTLKAAAGFQGIAVVDSDPYTASGANWYTNQNNFFRQVRNFVIDLTAMPESGGAGIHWQVAQATSLQNIRFEMVRNKQPSNKQVGIFMDNGSGGFMADLVFNGGNYGAFFGNQQFTSRNLAFNGCRTAIFMNWNWIWALKSISISNCDVGIDMANGGASKQLVGSVTLADSSISNTPVGLKTAFTNGSQPAGGGTLVLDNVDFSTCPTAVQSESGSTLLAGGQLVSSYVQGSLYHGSALQRSQAVQPGAKKPALLLGANNRVYERSKPQYERLPASAFVSVKSFGAAGDGVQDDTAAIQRAMDATADGQVLYFDHGAYVVTATVHVPANIKITGEIWPLIMAKGPFFADQHSPKAVFSVGRPFEAGCAELSDLIFQTAGPAPGAIMLEWNIAAAAGGAASSVGGLWDVHFRIGGSAGTQLQSDRCGKQASESTPDPACLGAFLLLHIAKGSAAYVENCWFWVADHELDRADHGQISVFSGRGVLVESDGPVWLYGTSSEHSVLYNYQLSGARNVYLSAIQSETPYFQSSPDATVPFAPQPAFHDPDFAAACAGAGNASACRKAWGLRVVNSRDVLLFGAGLYSFFDNYAQQCVDGQDCQQNILSVEGPADDNVSLYALSTKASVSMVTHDGRAAALDADNRSNFCATLGLWLPS